jgi:hypothetical protein
LLIAYQGSFYVKGFSAVGSHLKVSGPQRVTSEIKANAGHSIIVGRAALATFRAESLHSRIAPGSCPQGWSGTTKNALMPDIAAP